MSSEHANNPLPPASSICLFKLTQYYFPKLPKTDLPLSPASLLEYFLGFFISYRWSYRWRRISSISSNRHPSYRECWAFASCNERLLAGNSWKATFISRDKVWSRRRHDTMRIVSICLWVFALYWCSYIENKKERTGNVGQSCNVADATSVIRPDTLYFGILHVSFVLLLQKCCYCMLFKKDLPKLHSVVIFCDVYPTEKSKKSTGTLTLPFWFKICKYKVLEYT